jgi:hypothetical protein
MPWSPPTDPRADVWRQRAVELREMAQRSRSLASVDSLLKLAADIEDFANRLESGHHDAA